MEFHTCRSGLRTRKISCLEGTRTDPQLAEGHASLAYVRMFFDWDWPGAENSLLRSIELNPSYAVAHYWYALLLAIQARFREAQEQAQQAWIWTHFPRLRRQFAAGYF